MSHPGTFADADPTKAAVIVADTGSVLTYGELDAAANQLSHWFSEIGLGPGDHVAFCLENHRLFFPVAWAAHYSGLVYTAISSRLTAEEMEYIVNDCGARAMITSRHMSGVVARLETPAVEGRLMIGGTIDGWESFEDTVAARPTTPIDDRREGADMLYSSGTTGRPKGVVVTAPGTPLGEAPSSVQVLGQMLYGFGPDTVYLHPAPLYHAAPLRFCMAIHRLGGTVVAMEHFDAAAALEAISVHGVTASQWVPTMFVRMLKLDDEVRAAHDLSTLQVAIHAAAPCPVEVKKRMIEWWGPVIFEYYAGTEGNGFACCDSKEWLDHPGTVGKALVGEIHICDDDGNEVATGDVGTVYFGAGSEFEYHNDPDKTAASRHREGWSTLGDIGRVDDDGFLYLTDRKAHMIISGGVNVYPQEAENLLTMHPDVFDVAVIGVPHEEMGEEVKAVVQPAAGAAAGPELERALIAYCREHLASYKCPRSVDFRDDLPRHPTGKLYKRLLRDEYWSGRGGLI